MKKIVGFIFFIAILYSFKFDNGFVIKGHITNIEDSTWIRLYDIDQQIFLDSAILKNGEFILKGKVNNPTTCWIKCKDEYAIISMWEICGNTCGHGCIYLFKKVYGVWQLVSRTNCMLS